MSIALAILIALPTDVRAAIRPSFDSVICAWHATHIVVATEGAEIDGVLTVLESWKGDLRQGDEVAVRELAEFADEDARTVHPTMMDDLLRRKRGERIEGPSRVTCRRVVLFLRSAAARTGRGDEGERGSETRTRGPWVAAAREGWRYSVAWIEQGRVFAFFQSVNPGPSLLHRCGTTEKQLRESVNGTVKRWSDIQKARTVHGLDARARMLRGVTNKIH